MGRPRKKIEETHEPLMAEIHGNGGMQSWPPALVAQPVAAAGAKLTPTTMDNLKGVAPAVVYNVPTVSFPPLLTPAKEKELKVAVVGTAPSSRMLAPFNDPSWTIWVCSPGNMGVMPRVDAWFEIHTNLLWPECVHYGAPYVEWLKKQSFPIYMQDNSLVPNAIPLPRSELVKEFGKDFWTSSFAWMMALAIKQGAKEIALFGVDMASRDEYILQRPGFFFFRHIAEQRGIKVWAPNESDIMMSPGQYGYWEGTPFGRKIMAREKEIKDRLGVLRPQRDGINQQIIYLEGALEDIDYFKTIWPGVATLD